MKTVAIAACAAALVGCADIPAPMVPTYAAVELNHISHASQHFGPDPTNYGIDVLQLNIHWNITSRWYAELAEGVVLEPCYRARGTTWDQCGALDGPREVFNGKVGFILGGSRQ